MPVTPVPPAKGDWESPLLKETLEWPQGGVLSNLEPYYLQDNQVPYMKNVDLTKPGLIKTRHGSQSIGGPTNTAAPAGLGTWYEEYLTRERRLVGVWGNAVWSTTGDGNFTVRGTDVSLTDGTLWNIVAGQCSTNLSAVDSSIFLAGVYPWTGVTNTQLYVLHGDGLSTGLSLCPRAIQWWQGRLWMFNFSNPAFGPNTLMWSSILDGLAISTTNNIEINPNDGDEGVAIVPSRGVNPRLYLFKKHAIYALDVVWSGGVYLPSTQNSLDTVNSRLVLVSENVGCVAPKTIAYASGSAESDVFFLAADGLRSLKRVEQDVAGGASLPVSDPIRDIMDRVNWVAAHVAVAAVFESKYYLSLPVDGSAVNNLTVVFDLERKVWIGEYSWAPTDYVTWTFAGDSPALYYQYPDNTTEGPFGSTDATDTNHVFQALVSGSFYDPSLAAVDYRVDSRAFTFGTLEQIKRWNYMHLFMQPATSSVTLSILAAVDDGSFVEIAATPVAHEVEYPVLPAALPWAFEQTKLQQYQLGLMDLPPGKRLQLSLRTSSPAVFGLRRAVTTAWLYPENWE
jgi:hypothetical protein